MSAGTLLAVVAGFDSGRLPKARNLPLDRLLSMLEAIGYKDRPMVVYWKSATRSAAAAGAPSAAPATLPS